MTLSSRLARQACSIISIWGDCASTIAAEKMSYTLRNSRPQILDQSSVLSKRRLFVGRVSRVRRRHDPLGGSLEQRQRVDPVDDGRHDLHGGRPRTDDPRPGPRRARRRGSIVRCGTGPGKAVLTRDIGIFGVVKHSGGRDDHIDFVTAPRRRQEAATCHFRTHSARLPRRSGCRERPRGDGQRPRSMPGSRLPGSTGGSIPD